MSRDQADAPAAEGLHQVVGMDRACSRISARPPTSSRVQPVDPGSGRDGQAGSRTHTKPGASEAITISFPESSSCDSVERNSRSLERQSLHCWLRSASRAHHGTLVAHDRSKQWTEKAVVTEFHYVNPHVQLFFDTKDAKGKVTHWSGELLPNPAQLIRAGWTRKRSVEALQAGHDDYGNGRACQSRGSSGARSANPRREGRGVARRRSDPGWTGHAATRSQSVRSAPSIRWAIILAVVLSSGVRAQRGGPPQPPSSPRASAPVDLTGYWLSLVTEDWRHRMTGGTQREITWECH